MSLRSKSQGFKTVFHANEIAFCGFSGTGKTTLIGRLIEQLKPSWHLAYIKHDAHRFEVDKPGKDTFEMRRAGASAAYISGPNGFAWMGDEEPSRLLRPGLFADYDAVLVEGHKNLAIDKIVLLDAERKVLTQMEHGDRVVAYIGADDDPSEEQARFQDRPYFHRNDVQAIAAFIEQRWMDQFLARPLHGLILAGGFSSRMGRDKALLTYQGESQAVRLRQQMIDVGIQPFLSLRDGQWPSEDLNGFEVIHDRLLNFGPIGGILSAMFARPEAAWLVVACDLPLLSSPVLRNLMEHRKPMKLATAYRSTEEGGLPEPLCTIYEPEARALLLRAMSAGYSCPRKALINSNSHVIEPFEAKALTNANTPEDYSRSLRELSEQAGVQ